MNLDEKIVNQIVEKVVEKLADQGVADKKKQKIPKDPSGDSDGVFQDMETCIKAAAIAQEKLLLLPVEIRRKLVQAIRDIALANAEEYGRLEFEETGLGKPDDNVAKVRSSCYVPGMEDLSPEVYAGDKGVTIIERLPIGVIASINPITNGAPTIIFNAIMMMAGGNSVVDNPHPKTKKVSARVIRDLNQAIVAAGGPPNCICCLQEPTVPTGYRNHPDIRMGH